MIRGNEKSKRFSLFPLFDVEIAHTLSLMVKSNSSKCFFNGLISAIAPESENSLLYYNTIELQKAGRSIEMHLVVESVNETFHISGQLTVPKLKYLNKIENVKGRRLRI